MDEQRTPFVGRPLPLALALSLVYAAMLTSMPASAQAPAAGSASVTSTYAIEQGPLEQTLLSIGRQSGRTIAFDPARVRSVISQPVQGALTAEAAVRAALQGSGLDLVVKPDGTLSVSEPGASTSGPAEAALVASLKAITVVAQRDQAETSFKVDRTNTSTRSDTDLMDLPSSVTVVTSKVLESQQATSVQDAIAQVAGVIYTQSPQGTPAFSIRGFGQTSALSNGLSSSASTSANVAGVERIEVLKGPQAILSGQGSLGGAVNIVTKKPQADPIRELTLQYASHDDKVVAVDLSGAISEDKKLTYRLIASAEDQNKNYAGYDGRNAQYLMPELRWKDDSTDVIVGYVVDNSRGAPPAYTFAYRGYVQDRPEQLLGHESDGFGLKSKSLFYTWTQKLGSDVKFTSKMQRADNDLSLKMHSPLGLAGTDRIFFSPTHGEQSTVTIAGDHYLEFGAKSGPISHKVTAGISHDTTKYSQLEFSGSGQVVPVYGSQFPFTESNGTPASFFVQKGKQIGGYAMDLMSWGDASLLLGARRTQYTSDFHSVDFSNGKTTVTPTAGLWKTTPMVGIVYRVTPTVSAYASYTEGYLPQLGTPMCDGSASPSMQTKNKEAGLKFDLFDSKFSVTTSVFTLDQTNVLSYNSARRCNTVIGGQQTKGVELDMAGEVYRGLNLLFNATYSTLDDASGNTLVYAARPVQRASLWATYDFQSEQMRGWGVGLGVTGNDKSYLGSKTKTSTTDPVKLGGSARVDGNVSYRQKDWSLMLGVKNLFDRELYDFATTNTYVPIQPGRTFTLTYKVNF